ncbi:MAG TPA: branched-chain amino acid ABC transporter substrate-binding protein, partial [Pseudomonas sp.]|nr:branched-chain amino acid ABC transporter substrate-binding protein [Pseudomonas sp.]
MRHVLRRAGLLAALACCAPFALAAAGAELEVRIGYLGYRPDPGPLLSNVIPEPEDVGLRGAELAITDSNSTGRFLKHSYVLDAVTSETSDDLLQQAARQHADGLRLFVVN